MLYIVRFMLPPPMNLTDATARAEHLQQALRRYVALSEGGRDEEANYFRTEPKLLIALLGLPGTGKGDIAQCFQERFGAVLYHFPHFIHQRRITEVDEQYAAFGKALKQDHHRTLLLDGFPRTPEQAVWLAGLGLPVLVVHLHYGEKAMEYALVHYATRLLEKQEDPDLPQYTLHLEKNRRLLDETLQTLRTSGLTVHTLQASNHRRELFATILRESGLALNDYPLPQEALSILRDQSQSLGVEAWLQGDALPYALWNGVYGEVKQPKRLTVSCLHAGDAARLRVALQAEAPSLCWEVRGLKEETKLRYGLSVSLLKEGFLANPFGLEQAALCLGRDGKVEFFMPGLAERSLRNGVLHLDHKAINRLPVTHREPALLEALKSMRYFTAQYRSLSVAPGLARNRYQAAYGTYLPLPMTSSTALLQQRLQETEIALRETMEKSRSIVSVEDGKEKRPILRLRL
jgi:adenylate kinase family enzyme